MSLQGTEKIMLGPKHRQVEVSGPEFIVIRENSTKVHWSSDYFDQDDNNATYSNISRAGFNGDSAGCGWYITGTTSTCGFVFTKDAGSTWSSVTAPYNSTYAYMSDGGDYIIIGGDESNTGTPFHKCYNPSDGWYTISSTKYHNGSYGGNVATLSRDGSTCIALTRSDGSIYNTNYLDENSWNQGIDNISTATFRSVSMAHDGSCWCWGSTSWDYEFYWSNHMTGLTTNQYHTNIAAPGVLAAFKGQRVWVVDSTNNNTYSGTNASSLTTVSSTEELMLTTDDDFSIHFKNNRDTGAATLNGNSVSNVYSNSPYVSRDGLHAIYCNSSDGKLYYSNNGGTSWADRTPSGATSMSAAYGVQQWNRTFYG